MQIIPTITDNMAHIILVLFLGLIAAGCAAEPMHSNNDGDYNSNSSNVYATPSQVISPDEIDLEYPFDAGDFDEAFADSQSSWIGKEIAITGVYKSLVVARCLNCRDKFRISVADQATGEVSATCVVKERPDDNEFRQGFEYEFRGVIKKEEVGKAYLDPCLPIASD